MWEISFLSPCFAINCHMDVAVFLNLFSAYDNISMRGKFRLSGGAVFAAKTAK